MTVSSPTTIPEPAQIVRVRSRTCLVEEVESDLEYGSTIHMACLDDDAQGDLLSVNWDLELDAKVMRKEGWHKIGQKGFDPPNLFASYLNTLRWNCVTATNPDLFQAPFRAGIKIEPYQLEPLRKALRLPRVNLFIATELLLRRRIRDIVVACPPSMCHSRNIQ